MNEQNRRLVLAQRPTGLVDDNTLRLEAEPVPTLSDGEVLVKVRYLSIDPTIRTWMNDVPSYLPPIQIGEVIRSGGVGEVIESRTEAYQPGQLVFGFTGWQDFVRRARSSPPSTSSRDSNTPLTRSISCSAAETPAK